MKINSNINIQNYNWSQVQSHIERKFEDKKLSKRQYDSNLDINWKLSQYNRSTDGHIRHDSNGNNHWINNPRKYHHIEAIKKQFIKSHVKAYIKRFNASKSVKKNPKRKIKNPLSLFNPDRQRTTVDSFGDSASNYHNIKLIQHTYKRGYHNAYIRYIKAVGYGLQQYERNFNKRHHDIKKLHCCTNVDETTGVGKPSDKPDALHEQTNMIAFSWSKYDKNGSPAKASITTDKNGKKHRHYGAKPSFSIGRTLCHKYGLAYTKRNVSKATSKFDAEESPILCKTVSRILADRFKKVPEFRNIVYTPKNAKITGINNKKLKEIYAKADKRARREAEINRRTSQRLDNERRRIQKVKANRRRNRKRARRASLVRKRNASIASSVASSTANHVASISVASKSINMASNSILSASNSVYIASSSNEDLYSTTATELGLSAMSNSSVSVANSSIASSLSSASQSTSVVMQNNEIVESKQNIRIRANDNKIKIGNKNLSNQVSRINQNGSILSNQATDISKNRATLHQTKSAVGKWSRRLNELKNSVHAITSHIRRTFNLAKHKAWHWLTHNINAYKFEVTPTKKLAKQGMKKAHPTTRKFDLSRSPYWSQFRIWKYDKNLMNKNALIAYPDPANKDNLQLFQMFSIKRFFQGSRTPHNLIERNINKSVGADLQNPDNYTEPWYILGYDSKPNDWDKKHPKESQKDRGGKQPE